MSRIRPFVYRIAAAGFLFPAALTAQEVRDTVPRYRLEGIRVTAVGIPSELSRTPVQVHVVTELDIERTPATDIADLLKKTAGVDVVQYPSLLAGVGIRGFRPEPTGINPRTLILIDGRAAGTPNLAILNMGSIERIEVVKGPASALYGSSAMAGVVNIVTRRSSGEPAGRLSAAYGSFATTEVAGRIGGALGDRLDMDLDATWFRRADDFRIGDTNLLRDMIGSDVATKLYEDGRSESVPEIGDGRTRPHSRLEYFAGGARLGYRLTDTFRAEVRGELFDASDVQTPGDFYFDAKQDALKNVTRRTTELSLRGAWNGFSQLLRVFSSREATENYDALDADRFINYTAVTRSHGAQLQVGRASGHRDFLAGLDYSTTTAVSRRYEAPDQEIGTYSPNSGIHSLAVFGQLRVTALGDRLVATLGSRLDRVNLDLNETPFRPDVSAGRETFHSINPSLGVQLGASDVVRVHGSIGTAFVAPDAFDKAGVASAMSAGGVATYSVGNPRLTPESSLTWDAGVGIRAPRSGWDADITWFSTLVNDRITSVRATFPADSGPRTSDGVAVGSVNTYVNAANAEIDGIEWSLGYDFGAAIDFRRSIRIFANATHILRARQTTRAVGVDVSRFADRNDFRPDEVVDAFVFGAPARDGIRNVADLTITGGVEYDDLRRLSTRITVRHVGERLDQDFRDFANITDIRYPAFMIVDWTGTLRFREHYALSAIVKNATDENYYEKRGYNLPGRELSVRLSADF